MTGGDTVALPDSEKLERLCEVLRSREPPNPDPQVQRAHFAAVMSATPPADQVLITREHVAGIPIEWLVPAEASSARTLLYLHGGGYVMGSPDTARRLAARIATLTGARVALPDYRLAPEHPFPAALLDATAAYRRLVGEVCPPSELVVAGDSAGGGLAVATLLAAHDAGLPMPVAVACLSPWTDLTLSGATLRTNAASDPQVRYHHLARWATDYLAGHDAEDPLASPGFGELTGLPPMLIHAGAAELLADDALLLAGAARRAGVEVTCELYDRMIHVWHGFFPGLPEATAALERLAEWLDRRWRTAASATGTCSPVRVPPTAVR